MKTPLSLLVLTIGFFSGYFSTATLAQGGSLILPEDINSNIVWDIQKTPIATDPSEFLKVFVGRRDKCCKTSTPMAGQYRVSGTRITFDPVFEFIEGQSYTVMSRDRIAEYLPSPTLTEFTIQPGVPAQPPEVVAIYPGGDDIPENTLRFYIHFSTPMQPHRSTEFIKLIDDSGTTDSAAFMAFKQELWSEDRTRLTLLMDPGRIKRGVQQNLALGPALQQNNRYSIVVEAGWPSANGKQKAPRFEKVFSVSPALRTLPSTALWSIAPPRAQSVDALVIEFDRQFDHQLSQSSIRILDTNGRFIPGKVSVENYEKTWRFEPQSKWRNEKVLIVVDARFEDIAGNNFRDLLDHSVGSAENTTNQHTITLELKP